MSSESSRAQSVIQITGAFAAMIAAAVALAAYVFSSPMDLNNEVRILLGRHFVKIDTPLDQEAVNRTVDISGTASIPSDWNLVVLVQTPDELKYYVTSGGAISVGQDNRWTLTGVDFGSSDPKARKDDLGKDYKIIALLLDEEGQTQVQKALAIKGDPWLSSLPHHAAASRVNVHLTS